MPGKQRLFSHTLHFGAICNILAKFFFVEVTMAEAVMRVTATGVDSGGYIFENVFHVKGTFTTESAYALASQLNDFLSDPFFVTYLEAFPNVVKILTSSVAMVDPDQGLTHVHTINEFGAREVIQASGTLALGIKLIPDDGVPPVGHQYVPCLGDGDVENDLVVVDASFNALKNAYASIDGSAPTHAWKIGIYRKDNNSFRDVTFCDLLVKPVVLSKRQRA